MLNISSVLETAIVFQVLGLSLNLLLRVSFHFFSQLLPHPISSSFSGWPLVVMQSNLFCVVCHSLDTDISMCHRCAQLGTEFSCFIRYLVSISSCPLHSSPVTLQEAAGRAWLSACWEAVQSKWSSCYFTSPMETRVVSVKLQLLSRSHDASCRRWS